MATGGHGIVISVLAFVIVCNLCPSSETFSDEKKKKKRTSDCESLLYLFIDLLFK